jgi:hypothetical protein
VSKSIFSPARVFSLRRVRNQLIKHLPKILHYTGICYTSTIRQHIFPFLSPVPKGIKVLAEVYSMPIPVLVLNKSIVKIYINGWKRNLCMAEWSSAGCFTTHGLTHYPGNSGPIADIKIINLF